MKEYACVPARRIRIGEMGDICMQSPLHILPVEVLLHVVLSAWIIS